MVIQDNDNTNNEIWKDIPGYEGLYQVSNQGRVKSFPRNGTRNEERILKTTPGAYGYHRVGLYKNNNPKTVKVHAIVALAFIGKRPDGMTINHKNGIKSDNRPDNLEYCTIKENLQHAHRTGLIDPLKISGEKHGNSRLTAEQVLEIRALHKGGNITQAELADRYGVGRQHMSDIINRKRWSHI